MTVAALDEINLTGLSLKAKTVNANGQSSLDCENLWHEFHKAGYTEKIPGKLSEEIFGVYYQYEGDSSRPFSYFIGCKVKAGASVPEGLHSLTIPKGKYQKIIAKGKMPDCITCAWKEIWASDFPRAYQIDFEIYDERSKDWNEAEVEVYLSVKDE